MSMKRAILASALIAVSLCSHASSLEMKTPDEARAIVARGIPHAEREIAKIATDIANSRAFFEKDYGRINISARYDVERGILFLDPGERFGPVSGFFEVEDLHSWIRASLEPITALLPNYSYTEWLYGGHDLYRWFPQDKRQPVSVNQELMPQALAQPHALVSAGHGYYYHHGFKDWRPQRERTNGILEDEITIPLVELFSWELMISGVNVTGTRNAAFKDHEPSKQPYHMIAAKYQLEDLLPDHPEIWHSFPDATDDLREYREDIVSRPLYANFLGVSEAIHVHTNAAGPAASGTRVIVQKDRPEDFRLGKLILCYMKEHIQNIPDYEKFNVAEAPEIDNKGENRVANMPSAIIEVAFHTNASDAEALKDIRFQAAAMKGAAKGYRLFKRGDDCATFSVSMPEKSSGVAGSSISFPIKFEGNPDFPVMLEVDEDCSGPYCYRGVDAFYSKEEFENYTHSYSCRKEPAYRPEVKLIAKAHDYKGVITAEATHTVLCAPAPGP